MADDVDSLERDLADLAPLWRSARGRGDPAEELTLRREYLDVLQALWDRGWRGEGMYVDMELPDEFMPDYYLEHLKRQSEQDWEHERQDYKDGRVTSPVPLELPRIAGAGTVLDAPPLRVVVLPIEVYSTGALVRTRVQHTELPDDVLAHPDRVWLTFPRSGDYGVRIVLGTGIRTSSLDLVSGRPSGPGRWDLEFWLDKYSWGSVATARLKWLVAGLDLPLPVSTDDLETALDRPPD